MQQQLPYPYDAFIAAPIAISPGNPPFLPNISYMPQHLQQYYPLIVSACIDAIQARAQDTPLRVFMYNQMCDQRYNNPTFTAFVDGVVKFIDMRVAQGHYRDPNTAIMDASVTNASMQAAVNTQLFPALMGLLNQDQSIAVQRVLMDYQNILNQVRQYFQNQNQPMQNFQAPFAGSGVQFNNTQPGTSFGGNMGGNPNQFRGTQSHLQGHGNNQASGIFTTGNRVAPPVDRMAERYSTLPGAKQVEVIKPIAPSFQAQVINTSRFAQSVQALDKAQAIEIPILKPAIEAGKIYKPSDGVIVWKATEKNPVNIAYNPETSDLVYQIEEDGSLQPTIIKKAATMDQNAHIPGYISLHPIAVEVLDTSTRNYEVARVLKEDTESDKTTDTNALDITYDDVKYIASIGNEDIWLYNDLALAVKRKISGKVNVHRSLGLILSPMVTLKEPKPFINTLAASASFAQACAILNTAEKEMMLSKNDHPYLDVNSLNFINRQLTKHVNNYLHNELSIPTSIQNFMEDAAGLVQHIENKYSVAHARAINAKETALIKQALAYSDNDVTARQNDIFYNEKIDQEIICTYFEQRCTFTSLDLFSVELHMEIPESKTAVGVFEKATPLFRQICENIFVHATSLKEPFSNHYVQTADKVTLQVCRGEIGNDFYLVSPIK
jgi:hypothetical protein